MRQVTESHVGVAVLSRFTELARPTTVPVSVPAMAQLRLGLSLSRPEGGLSDKAARSRIPTGHLVETHKSHQESTAFQA
jgi:hypothetical protein